MDNLGITEYEKYQRGELNEEQIKNLHALAWKAYDEGNPFMSDNDFDEFVKDIRVMLKIKKEGAGDSDSDESDYTRNKDSSTLKEHEIKLPVPMPSFDKPSDKRGLDNWLAKMKCDEFLITAKLDGLSAQWCSDKKTLYGKKSDSSIGTNYTFFADYIQGLKPLKGMIVRGEIMLNKTSELAKTSSDPRNAAVGAINPQGDLNKKIEKAKQLTFVAYEIIEPKNISPLDQIRILENHEFEVPYNRVLDRESITPESLTNIFSLIENTEEMKHYNYDGLVVYPDIAREKDYKYELTSTGKIKNLKDRIGWKQRSNKKVYERTVTEVQWPNNKESKVLVPIVKFYPNIVYQIEGSIKPKNYDTVVLHNAGYVRDHGIGTNAKISISIAGDCIPKFEGTMTRVDPEYPEIDFEWDESKIRIFASEETENQKIDSLKKSLDALSVHGIGPKKIEDMFHKGFNSLEKIYSASVDDFLKLDRVAKKTAENIYNGLRIKKNDWTVVDFMVASRCFKHGIAESKFNLVFSISRDWKNWVYKEMKTKCPKGLPATTLEEILASMKNFKKFYDSFSAVVGEPKYLTAFDINAAASSSSHINADGGEKKDNEQNSNIQDKKTEIVKVSGRVLVFTGTTAKKLGIEQKLLARGDQIDDNLTKRTTHLVYSKLLKDSTKVTKAKEKKIPIIEVDKLWEISKDTD